VVVLQALPADAATVRTRWLRHPALRSIARILTHGLPDGRFMELNGSGHGTYAERPDEFTRAVTAFATEPHPAAGPH